MFLYPTEVYTHMINVVEFHESEVFLHYTDISKTFLVQIFWREGVKANQTMNPALSKTLECAWFFCEEQPEVLEKN